MTTNLTEQDILYNYFCGYPATPLYRSELVRALKHHGFPDATDRSMRAALEELRKEPRGAWIVAAGKGYKIARNMEEWHAGMSKEFKRYNSLGERIFAQMRNVKFQPAMTVPFQQLPLWEEANVQAVAE